MPTFSTIEIATVLIATSVLTYVLCRLVMRYLPVESRAQNNEVSGFIYATLGAVYAVIVAFVIIIVWEQYTDAEQTIQKEANALMDVVRDVDSMPQGTNEAVRRAAAHYVRHVVDYEWREMADGRESDSALVALKGLWSAIHTIRVETPEQSAYLQEALRNMTDMFNNRRLRILSSRQKVPAVLWILLVGGGIMTVGFAITFGARNNRLHTWHVVALAALIAFELYVIRTIERPYARSVLLKPDAFELIVDHLDRRL